MVEARRPRGRAVSAFIVLAFVGLAGTPAALSQTPVTMPGAGQRIWSLEIGAVRSTTLVEDGNGVTVCGATGTFVGAAVTLRRSRALSLVTGVRASTAPIRVKSSDRAWRAGRAQRYDLRIGIETDALPHVRLGAAGFAGLFTGPEDVIPFRRGHGHLATWGGEMTGSVPLVRARRIDLLLGGDVARVAAQANENPPLAAGWAGHLRLGVRYGFR